MIGAALFILGVLFLGFCVYSGKKVQRKLASSVEKVAQIEGREELTPWTENGWWCIVYQGREGTTWYVRYSGFNGLGVYTRKEGGYEERLSITPRNLDALWHVGDTPPE